MLVTPAIPVIPAATIITSSAIATHHLRRVSKFTATTMVDPDTGCRPAPAPPLQTIRTGVLTHQPHIATNGYLTKLVASMLGFAAEARFIAPFTTMGAVIGSGSGSAQRSHQAEKRCRERTRAQSHA
jgi:hypothetical protein